MSPLSKISGTHICAETILYTAESYCYYRDMGLVLIGVSSFHVELLIRIMFWYLLGDIFLEEAWDPIKSSVRHPTHILLAFQYGGGFNQSKLHGS